jgi:hypothetical protein
MEDAEVKNAQTVFRAVVGIGSIGLVGGCLGGGVESSEDAVCEGGMPGGMAVAASHDEGGPDRLIVVCWEDTTHAEPGWLALYKAGEDGTLERAASHGVGRQPGNPVVADLDGDGSDDLLVANTGGVSDQHYLSFLGGRGDGTFEEERRLPPVRADFVVNDVNGDGPPDFVLPKDKAALIVQSLADGQVQRRRLPGIDGSRVSGDVVPGQHRTERFAALVDRDAGKLHVYKAGESGGFEVALPEGQPLPHSVLGVAEMNGDARPDLVVAIQKEASTERRLHLLLSTGDSSWKLSPAIESITEKPGKVALATGGGDTGLHVFVSCRRTGRSSLRIFARTGRPTCHILMWISFVPEMSGMGQHAWGPPAGVA